MFNFVLDISFHVRGKKKVHDLKLLHSAVYSNDNLEAKRALCCSQKISSGTNTALLYGFKGITVTPYTDLHTEGIVSETFCNML